jgi:hypothetical protein
MPQLLVGDVPGTSSMRISVLSEGLIRQDRDER